MGRRCSFNVKRCPASLLIKETKVETAISVISYRLAKTKKKKFSDILFVWV